MKSSVTKSFRKRLDDLPASVQDQVCHYSRLLVAGEAEREPATYDKADRPVARVISCSDNHL